MTLIFGIIYSVAIDIIQSWYLIVGCSFNPKNVGNDSETEQWEATGKILRRMSIVSAMFSGWSIFLSDERNMVVLSCLLRLCHLLSKIFFNYPM